MNDILFAGRAITLKLLDGSSVETRVRQLSLKEYERAFTLLDDEIALTAFMCGDGHTKDFADNIAPESYEALYAVAQEVNAKGFFVWSERRVKKAQAEHERNLAMMEKLSPDVVKMAMDAGLAASTSQRGPRGPQPR